MNTYAFRKNFIATFSDQEKSIRARVVFKTKKTDWVGTASPSIVLMSTQSAFHEGYSGHLKMNALISTIKNQVKGKVTILVAERAHLHATSIKYQNNLEKAFDECFRNGRELTNRYHSYFEECNVAFWHSYVSEDADFASYVTLLRNLCRSDSIFVQKLIQDADVCFNHQRMLEFSDKALFIEKTVEDLIEQCACLLVLAHKGYRFQFYPGSSNVSTEYVNRLLLPIEKQISWIDVFVAIEKKTVTPNVILEPFQFSSRQLGDFSVR